jgi:hypothetical protein
MKEPNVNIDKQTLSQEDLLSGLASGDYSHLKLFMYREQYDFKLPQDFLWVDNNNFGKVTVEDIWYSGNTIFLEVREYTTGFVKQINIDINEEQDFQMVRWQDIIEMVKREYRSSITDDHLLDFDY